MSRSPPGRWKGGRYWVLGGLAAALVLGLNLAPSETSELSRRLEQLTAAVRTEPGWNLADRRARLQQAGAGILGQGVIVTVPELPLSRTGSENLFEALSQALGKYPQARIIVGRISSRVDPSHQAAVTDVEATFRAEDPEGVHLDRRNAVVYWNKEAGAWRVTRVYVSEHDHALPEARP